MYQAFYRGSDLLHLPLLSLGLFLSFFIGTIAWAYRPRSAPRFAEHAALPLAEDLDGQR